MGDMIDRDAVLAEIAKEGLHILDAAIRALPAADARAEALKEAAAIAQGYHDRAIKWAKTVRGLEQHIGETDSSRIASAILALITEKQQ